MLQDKRSEKTATSSREAGTSRAGVEDPMLEFVRDVSVSNLEVFKFNDRTDFDIDVTPAVVWE